MAELLLDDDITLETEMEDGKLRLIIVKGNEEWVCHKTTLKEINQFLAGEEHSLFKGRLQLIKDQDNILIKVKDEIVGVVDSKCFIFVREDTNKG